VLAPERVTATVMLSNESATDTVSKPRLRAITSSHSRVRMAVLPARSMAAPNRSSTSTASARTAAVAPPSVDDLVCGIDIERLAGDEACRVVGEECGGDAHVVDADEAARRSLRARLLEQRVEFGNSRGRSRRQWPGRDGVHADSLWTQLGCHVAHAAFQC